MPKLSAFRKMAAIAMISLGTSVAVPGDLIVTNAAGVSAGITGIVRRSDNSIGVDFEITDPTGTNVTTFNIQTSQDLITWTNLTQQSVTYTGSVPGEISGGFASSPAKFYRMYLINFR
ncbi:MAG TPA: hypothetical protein VL171_14365 [Verrucomicrobiae bacterium]|nr:hypothetical protein [Verrucomicrobiae bacterium]